MSPTLDLCHRSVITAAIVLVVNDVDSILLDDVSSIFVVTKKTVLVLVDRGKKTFFLRMQ